MKHKGVAPASCSRSAHKDLSYVRIALDTRGLCSLDGRSKAGIATLPKRQAGARGRFGRPCLQLAWRALHACEPLATLLPNVQIIGTSPRAHTLFPQGPGLEGPEPRHHRIEVRERSVHF